MLENLVEMFIMLGAAIILVLAYLGGFLLYILSYLSKKERYKIFLEIKERIKFNKKVEQGEIKIYNKEEMKAMLDKVRKELEDEENQRKNQKES